MATFSGTQLESKVRTFAVRMTSLRKKNKQSRFFEHNYVYRKYSWQSDPHEYYTL